MSSIRDLYPEDWASWSPCRRKLEEAYHKARTRAEAKASRQYQKVQDAMAARMRAILQRRDEEVDAARRAYEEGQRRDPDVIAAQPEAGGER